jgi:hypothetical protein
VAIKFHPEITLAEHFFDKSGDAWRFALPRLRQMPIAFEVLALLNIKLLWQSARHRVPAPCPACGVTRLSRDDNFVLVFLGGGVFDLSGGRNQPHRVTCSACDAAIDVLALLDDLNLSAKERDALLDGPFKKYAPTMSTWVVADVDGKFGLGNTVPEALEPLLGATYENEQRVSRVMHYSREQATRLAREHSKDMPWRTVEIVPATLEAKNPRWHGGPLAEWELRKIEDGKVAARIIETKALDVELEQIRRQRLAEMA